VRSPKCVIRSGAPTKTKSYISSAPRARTLLRRCQPQIRNLGPWTGSKEGEVDRPASALSHNAYRARLHDCLRTHQQAQPRGPHGPASAARASRVPRLQGQRRGGSARWVEKEDVLAMRWARLGQGAGRPITEWPNENAPQGWRQPPRPRGTIALAASRKCVSLTLAPRRS
jgi:hypothetical protein